MAIRETKSSALKLALITGTDNEGDHILSTALIPLSLMLT